MSRGVRERACNKALTALAYRRETSLAAKALKCNSLVPGVFKAKSLRLSSTG